MKRIKSIQVISALLTIAACSASAAACPRITFVPEPVDDPDKWTTLNCQGQCTITIKTVPTVLDPKCEVKPKFECQVDKSIVPGIIVVWKGAKINWRIESADTSFNDIDVDFSPTRTTYGINFTRNDWSSYFTKGSKTSTLLSIRRRTDFPSPSKRRVFAYDINVKQGNNICENYGPLIVNRD